MPIPLHIYLGPIVKLLDLLLRDVRDTVEALPVEARRALTKYGTVRDFVEGLRWDVNDDRLLLASARTAENSSATDIRRRSNGLRINATDEALAKASVSPATIKLVQQARKVHAALQDKVAKLTADVKAADAELAKQDAVLVGLATARGELGPVEAALEDFLKKIKVRSKSF